MTTRFVSLASSMARETYGYSWDSTTEGVFSSAAAPAVLGARYAKSPARWTSETRPCGARRTVSCPRFLRCAAEEPRLALLLEAIAVAADRDGVAVGEQAIEDRGRQHVVGGDGAPLGHELEEQMRADFLSLPTAWNSCCAAMNARGSPATGLRRGSALSCDRIGPRSLRVGRRSSSGPRCSQRLTTRRQSSEARTKPGDGDRARPPPPAA